MKASAGHDDRAQPQLDRLHHRVERRLARGLLLDREFDDQDGVLRRQADDRDQPDVEIDVGIDSRGSSTAAPRRASRSARPAAPRPAPPSFRTARRAAGRRRPSTGRAAARSGPPIAAPHRKCRSIRSAKPGGSVARQPLHLGHRLAGRLARRGLARNGHRGIAVIALQLRRARRSIRRVAKAPNGTISPVALRTLRSRMSCGRHAIARRRPASARAARGLRARSRWRRRCRN